MSFDIRGYVSFNSNGRAYCPSCEQKKGRQPSQRSLAIVPGTDGAYVCHAGCSVEEIRLALGQPKPRSHQECAPVVKKTPNSQQSTKGAKLYSELQVGKFVGMLINGQGADAKAARQWLHERGITSDMIIHYKLGLMSSPIGIGIPIPANEDTRQFYIKIRRSPWLQPKEQPWSQWGIPAITFHTYQPPDPEQTWLCEGEWDALLLGWHLRQANVKEIAVATFTCGCRSVPPQDQLEQLLGEVIIFYDCDAAGQQGAEKVARTLQTGGKAELWCFSMRTVGLGKPCWSTTSLRQWLWESHGIFFRCSREES